MIDTVQNKKLKNLTWLLMIISSILPLVILKEVFKIEPNWFFEAQLIIFFILLLASFIFDLLKKIRLYILMVLILIGTQWLTTIIQSLATWNNLFNNITNDFILLLLKGQLLKLAAALIIFIVLLYFKKRPKNFFIAMGDIDGEVKPIKFILTEPPNWKKLGFTFAIYLSIGTLIFLVIAGGIPSLDKLISIIPIFPLIIIFAAINSFYEELGYRAALISVLEDKIGSKQSLYLTSVFFGIAHFYGVPYGVVGVIMATFLGYIIGKSMLETRGFFWAFIIHMILDILIFSFMALNMITPGG